ncbi:MAG TPA: MBL fold metallo-hydrolase [Pirellulaceae bacterium]|nr:MBL fold metallo-hydrolase [Pirellulaceae bacterium]HMO91838.1 MBL fold metallo-hydrolase [Pirellulaceae bacterium]HMP69901.1 MBL fold metallo-hydrolase [Pirellulaceae bacterium]
MIALQSGSNGNSYYVEVGGLRLLIDAGISGGAAIQRLQQYGRDPRKADALLITHDHVDHTRCMGVFHRKFRVPVHVTKSTYAAASRTGKLGRIDDLKFFDPGDVLRFNKGQGEVIVSTIATPHDAVEGVAFVIEHDHKRLGILTDLGHAFDGLRDVLLSLDAVILESNYDPEMLRNGRYPLGLQRRIRGPGGHLSNFEAAELLSRVTLFGRLRWACLCHLSQDNNTPQIAMETHRKLLGRQFPLYISSRTAATPVLSLADNFSQNAIPPMP